MPESEEEKFDWQGQAISLLVSGPIFAFGYAAASVHLSWALAAVFWHLAAIVVVSLVYADEDSDG